MCFSAAPSSENDHGSMNLASNTTPLPATITVKRRPHPLQHRVTEPMLNAFNDLPSLALIAVPVEGFGREAELDDEVAGKVLRLRLAALLAPKRLGCPLHHGRRAASSSPPMRLRRSAGLYRTLMRALDSANQRRMRGRRGPPRHREGQVCRGHPAPYRRGSRLHRPRVHRTPCLAR